MSIRWTPQQDFCLRVGLLRALVACLPGHGRSTARQALVRTIKKALFRPAKSEPELLDRAAHALREHPPEDLTVANALLMASSSCSWGQPIDGKKIAKLLEWGRHVGLLGRGYQMTERAHLLRAQFPTEEVLAFSRGDALAWNPFDIPSVERGLWTYHLGELDEVLWRLAVAAGDQPRSAIPAAEARKMTLDAMRAFVESAQTRVHMSDLPRLRVVRELVDVVAVDLGEPAAGRARLRGPQRRPRRPSRRTSRRTTKNADHQTIPRFEVLVDLGFLKKGVPVGLRGKALIKARNAWTYVVTDRARRFSQYVRSQEADLSGPWYWRHFAGALAEGRLSPVPKAASLEEACDLFLRSYATVRRRAGHTPFESAALITSLNGLEEGRVVEIQRLHDCFVHLKRSGDLGDVLHFASGDEIDKMFLHIAEASRGTLIEWARRRAAGGPSFP